MTIKNYCLTITMILLLVLEIYSQNQPGICEEDERSLTGNPRVGRIWKQDTGECKGTAFLIANGKLITAGHVAAQMIYTYPNSVYYVEFNDFGSEDRYKVNKSSIINDETFENDGFDSGHDWAVIEVDTNIETGLEAIDAQDAYFKIMQTTNLQEQITLFITD